MCWGYTVFTGQHLIPDKLLHMVYKCRTKKENLQFKSCCKLSFCSTNQILLSIRYLSLSITELTTSVLPFCRASWRNEVSVLFKTMSAPRVSMSLTAATCPSFAAMCSTVFWFINARQQTALFINYRALTSILFSATGSYWCMNFFTQQ